MDENAVGEIVERVIRARVTEKVLCEVDAHRPVPEEVAARWRGVVRQSVRTAGWAPFHYARKVDGLAEPWRAHVLWDADAHKAALYMRDQMGLASKEPLLAAATSALVLVTWLPEFADEAARAASNLNPEQQRARDEEHLAAASAMVQNLLLALTAHGLGTYWSSGGQLRGPEMFDLLGIPPSERLLAAVFIEYPEMKTAATLRKPGAHRNERSDAWIREVSL